MTAEELDKFMEPVRRARALISTEPPWMQDYLVHAARHDPYRPCRLLPVRDYQAAAGKLSTQDDSRQNSDRRKEMTALELKPCPFCGGEAVALTGPVKTLWGVTCLRCPCWTDDRADTADEAIAAWNRRADLAALETQPDPDWAVKMHIPDPRDEVIARLVEALEMMRSTYPYNPPCYGWQEQVEAHKAAKSALAAAKAVQHG